MAKQWKAWFFSLIVIGFGILLLSCEPDKPATPKPTQMELATFLSDCSKSFYADYCRKSAQTKYGITDREFFDILAPPK
jgi:ferric iron reductase protein FhuF